MYDEGAEKPWQRTVLAGLGALAAAAVILGVVVGVILAGAARGLGSGIGRHRDG